VGLRSLNIVVEVRRRASEAKGPFPGGKRVGSWGKKKKVREKVKEKGVGRAPADLHPPLNKKGGLTVIEKRVGSWGKKVKENKRPMECVPWVSCFC
jgi:hypothetical protein